MIRRLAFIAIVAAFVSPLTPRGLPEAQDYVAPPQPLYGEISFDLEEDLIIGSETDEKKMFFQSIRLAVDSKGNILILDTGNFRIQVFDRHGGFIRSIGQKGEGPGEFRRPDLLLLDAEDHIYVFEHLGRLVRMHEFDDKGGLVRTARFDRRYFRAVGLLGPETILAAVFQEESIDLTVMNPEGRILKTIAGFPDPLPPEIKGQRLPNPFAPKLVSATFPSGGGVYGYSSEYRLFLVDAEGNITGSIKRESPPEPITSKDKQDLMARYLNRKVTFGQKLSRSEVRRAYELDKYQYCPFFSNVLCDEHDRIYVERRRVGAAEDSKRRFDIFSREGRFLYALELTVLPHLIRGGYVYTSKYDENTDYIRLIRYKIKNWEQLKAS